MARQLGNRDRAEPASVSARCRHAGKVAATVECAGITGEQLQRFSCAACCRDWWESDGEVVSLSDALKVIAEMARVPRPRGVAAKKAEWQAIADEGFLPEGAQRQFAALIAP